MSQSIILLAAGDSSRMGEPKGLLNYHGRPWLLEQLERIGRAGVIEVTLVVGSAADAYRNLLRKAELRSELEISLVVNPKPEQDKFSSLQCGLRGLDDDVFVLPVDVPAAEPETWKALRKAANGNWKAIMPSHGGRGGHPVLLSRTFVPQLRSLPAEGPDSRLDRQLHLLPDGMLRRVDVADPAIGLNLNTREEWEKYAALARK